MYNNCSIVQAIALVPEDRARRVQQVYLGHINVLLDVQPIIITNHCYVYATVFCCYDKFCDIQTHYLQGCQTARYRGNRCNRVVNPPTTMATGLHFLLTHE